MLQLDKVKTDESHPVKDLSYLKDFLKTDFENIYGSLSVPEKRELWRSIIREIRVDQDKNVRIIFL